MNNVVKKSYSVKCGITQLVLFYDGWLYDTEDITDFIAKVSDGIKHIYDLYKPYVERVDIFVEDLTIDIYNGKNGSINAILVSSGENLQNLSKTHEGKLHAKVDKLDMLEKLLRDMLTEIVTYIRLKVKVNAFMYKKKVPKREVI